MLFLALLSPAFARTTLQSEHVQVRIISPQEQIGSSNQLKLGVHFELDPDWHIYWKNSGDSGAAPKFQVRGGRLQGISWPFPQRIPVKDLTNFGYEHETVIFLDVLVEPGAAEVQLNLEWLVCKVECLPGFGELSHLIRRGSEASLKKSGDEQLQLYERFQNLVPKRTDSWKVKTIARDEGSLIFDLFAPSPEEHTGLKELLVFPENGEIFRTSMPTIEARQTFVRVSVPLSPNAQEDLESADFTFVLKREEAQTSFVQEVSLIPSQSSLFLGLLLAFLGGVILNLMPCVFPVLSLKFFSFLRETDEREIRRSSWAYTLGVLTTFFSVGALLTGLRISGQAIGWGYQLQNPGFIYLLALLFYVMALSFLGFIEMGNKLANFANRWGGARFLSGSFGTGVLAVVVASPCTAPFMGSALGLTLLLPAYQSLLIFLSLGLGMASPLLILGYWPRWVSKMPRSGAWMEVLKQGLAFPLFATSIWLLWVLANQKGADSVFTALGSFLIASLWVSVSAEIKVDAPAPKFEEKDANGEIQSLDKYKGKWLVLEWYNKDCPYVKKHYGSKNMQKLQEEFTGKKVAWLSVISSARGKQGYLKPAEALENATATGSHATAILMDEDGSMGKAYDAKTTPHMFVINPKGNVVYAGAIDNNDSSDPATIETSENYVKKALEEGMGDRKIATKTSKPYGCGVKYN